MSDPIIHDEKTFRRISRRDLFKVAPVLALGALALPGVQKNILANGLKFADLVSATWFRKNHFATDYPDSSLTPLDDFPYNSYDVDDPEVDLSAWRLNVGGLVKQPGAYQLKDLYPLPKLSQNTRHICVEGWDLVANFAGVRVSDFLKFVGADTTARYIAVECADNYYESLDMATALHPQSLLCYEMYGQPLRRGHGAPLRLRLPTKIGYKSAKGLTSLSVTNILQRQGYWEDQGYDWFYGL